MDIKTGSELRRDMDLSIGSLIVDQLRRIADAQEGMLAIAAEARVERLKLADQMKERFKAGFQGA